MSADQETSGVAGASRARLIAQAQERCHEARRQFIEIENSIGTGDESRVAAAEFHNAVIEYFYALRPLKDENAVSSFWDSVLLWEEQVEVPREDGRGYEFTTEEVTGFDTLEQHAIRKQTVSQQHSTALGKRTELSEVPVRMSPAILLRASAKLDEAAARLGFKPETDEQIIDTILEGGMRTLSKEGHT